MHKNEQSTTVLEWKEHLSRGRSLNFSQDFDTAPLSLYAFKDSTSLFWTIFTDRKI